MDENHRKQTSDLETVFSFLGYEKSLSGYGGENGLAGVPLCYWLRCLCGIKKISEPLNAGKRPKPEVLYFPLSENKYLVQALLALCCFFGPKERKHHPLIVHRICNEVCNDTGAKQARDGYREYLFLEVGQDQAVLVDRVRLRHLRLAANRISSGSLVAVCLAKKRCSPLDGAENSLIITEHADHHGACVLRIRRVLEIPASELLNGLFRLRKVNTLRSLKEQEQQTALPERLQTILFPYLYRQRKRGRRVPAHRARIIEIIKCYNRDDRHDTQEEL